VLSSGAVPSWGDWRRIGKMRRANDCGNRVSKKNGRGFTRGKGCAKALFHGWHEA